MSVGIATASQALSMAADWAVRSKLASTKRSAGPSDPGRGSRGDTNAGAPTKLPRASGVEPRTAGLKPLPRLLVSSAGEVSLGPFPENMLFRKVTLFGLDELMASPARELVWSWFSQKMLLATEAWAGVLAVLVRTR